VQKEEFLVIVLTLQTVTELTLGTAQLRDIGTVKREVVVG